MKQVTSFSPNTDKPSITITGAGVIGVVTARTLQQQGYSVTLIDKDEPAEACSSGNAGILAAYGVVPLSLPGILKKAPGMLLNPSGPLSIRRQYLLRIMPWLWQFWRASQPDRVEHIAAALAPLLRHTVRDYQNLIRGSNAQPLIVASPVLCTYHNETSYLNDKLVWDLRAKHGVTWSTLSGSAVQEMEPALTKECQFAAVFENCGFTVNPKRLVKSLFESFMHEGGTFIRTAVQHINPVNANEIHLQLANHDTHKTSRLVVACGAWSGLLTKALGEPVPLEQERGYHLTISNFDGIAPRYPIMSPAHKVIATPMETGLRIAGMVEFGGFLPPDPNRATALQQHLHSLFPHINAGTPSSWMGHRPSLPDSLPVIGPSKKHASLFYAFGHQHVGLSSAPMTARVISELIANQPTSIDITPFSVDRF